MKGEGNLPFQRGKRPKRTNRYILAGLPRPILIEYMGNIFSFGCYVIDQAYVRTHSSTDCTGRVGETIKRKGGVSQACLAKSAFFRLDIHNMVN